MDSLLIFLRVVSVINRFSSQSTLSALDSCSGVLRGAESVHGKDGRQVGTKDRGCCCCKIALSHGPSGKLFIGATFFIRVLILKRKNLALFPRPPPPRRPPRPPARPASFWVRYTLIHSHTHTSSPRSALNLSRCRRCRKQQPIRRFAVSARVHISSISLSVIYAN